MHLTKDSTSSCSREFSKDGEFSREVSSSADFSSLKSKSVRFLLSEIFLVLLYYFCTAPGTLGRTPSFRETDNVARSKRALIKYLQSRIMKSKDVLLLHLRLNVENAV